jgi:hypothetical protein
MLRSLIILGVTKYYQDGQTIENEAGEHVVTIREISTYKILIGKS